MLHLPHASHPVGSSTRFTSTQAPALSTHLPGTVCTQRTEQQRFVSKQLTVVSNHWRPEPAPAPPLYGTHCYEPGLYSSCSLLTELPQQRSRRVKLTGLHHTLLHSHCPHWESLPRSKEAPLLQECCSKSKRCKPDAEEQNATRRRIHTDSPQPSFSKASRRFSLRYCSELHTKLSHG